MRGFMVVIALYLVIALALPLYVMLSKSFSTFRFDLTAYEFQVSDAEGSFAARPITAAELNERLRAVPPERSEEHTSELQSLMRLSYAVFCLTQKNEHSIIVITK